MRNSSPWDLNTTNNSSQSESVIIITKARFTTLAKLAIPNLGGVISVNIMFLVDTAMVGVLDQGALTAVGIGGYIFALSASIMIGIGSGVQAITARRKGENDTARLENPFRAGLRLVLLAGTPLAILAGLVSPYVFDMLTDDPAVKGPGVAYALIRLPGVFLLGFNACNRGYWNGIGKPGIYGITMIVIQTLNIVFNYIFIYGSFGAPRLEVFGAGLASTLGILSGNLVYLGFILRNNPRMITNLKIINDTGLMGRVWKQAVPTGLQEAFTNLLMLVFLGLVGVFGTRAQDVSQVLLRILLAMTLPAIGIGFASAALIGQAIGRGDLKDAAEWGWDSIRVASIGALFFTMPMWLFPAWTLGLFINDPATAAYGAASTQLVGIMCNFTVIYMIMTLCYQGAGDPKRTLKVSLATHLLFGVPAGILAGPVFKIGMTAVWLVIMLNMIFLSLILLWYWRAGDWKHAKV